MEMTTLKTVAVFAIIIGCFAIIYPRMFHPLLFGGGNKNADDHINSHVPPHLRNPKSAHGGPNLDNFAHHMKTGPHGPHPGLRAMGEMRKQAETKGSGRGGGVMSMVLPLYAVGIVVYMVYTLVKVFTRKNAKENDQQQKKSNERNNYDQNNSNDSSSNQDGYPTEVNDLFLAGKKGQKELQKLLLKAEKDDINEDEITVLKRRLMETELQMSRILKAMELAEKKVGDISSTEDTAASSKEGKEGEKNLADELDEAQNGLLENLSHNGVVSSEMNDVINNDDDKSDSDELNGGLEELEEEDFDESGGDPASVESSEDGSEEIKDCEERQAEYVENISAGELRKRKAISTGVMVSDA